MTKNIISVALNCSLIFGLAIIQGCATTMDTRELPNNMDFGPSDAHGYQILKRITYSYPLPQVVESEYLDMMIECIDESLDYELIVLEDGSTLYIGKYMGMPYMGSHRDIVESSDVIIGVNPYAGIVEAVGSTSYPVFPTIAILRFSLTVIIGNNNNYVLQYHSISIALREFLSTKGFTRARNNPYQHPERIHEKTRLISEAINTCMTATRG